MNPNPKVYEKVYNFFCEKCDYKCIKQQHYDKHLLSNRHNKVITNPNKKVYEYYCEKCNYTCVKQQHYNKHLLTNKHKLLVNDVNNTKYCCESCNYNTINKDQYDKHLQTKKHISATTNSSNILENQEKNFVCKCGKKYKHYSSLCNHRHICNNKNINNTNSNKDLINYLIKENKEIKQNIIDMAKIPTNNNINNTTTNTICKNNKIFNLNFFLNTTCKDAMNIDDFIEKVKISISDLENVGKVGYINGITNIIVKTLKEMDITERPVHCCDLKRETLYVKDDNIWEKDTQQHNKMKNVIKHISHKNIKCLNNWRVLNPNHTNISSKTSDIYQTLISKSNDYNRVSTEDSESKIIKNVMKEIIINK
jgi:hypothetical protein